MVMISSNKVFYLFSSSQRQLYRQDNINVLGYPSGSIMHFRYDKKWVSTQITRRSLDGFKNSEAIIVIVDIEKKNDEYFPLFYPIRKARIKDVDFESDILHFHFELLPDWVDYRVGKGLRDFQECMSSLRERPTPGKKRLNGIFASFDELQQGIEFSSEAKAWESIIGKIGSSESYRETLFCRISGFYEIKSGNIVKMEDFGDSKSGYVLKSGKKYNLQLSLLYGKEPPDVAIRDRLVVKVDENFHAVIPDEITLGFRADKQNIYLLTKQLLSEAYTQLIITFKEGFVEGTNIIIPLRIRFDYWHVLGSLLLFVFGLILTSGIIPAPQLLKNVIKAAGTILVSLVTFYLYRKL